MSDIKVETSTKATEKINSDKLKWLTSILVPLLFLVIPLPQATTEIRIFLALTLWAVICWVTEIISDSLVGMILPVLYIIFKLAQPNQVFGGPWSTSVPWTVLGGMVIGMVIITSGLAKRIAYWTILKTGSSFKGLLLGIMLAGIIIAPFIPAVTGKIAIMAPIAVGICQALNLSPKSRASSAITLTAFLAVASPCNSYLTGGGQIVMATNLLASVTKSPISWSGYALHNFIINIIWSFLCVFIVMILLKPEKDIAAKEIIEQKYNELGKVTSDQRKIALLLVFTLAALVTDKFHKIDSGWVFMLVAAVCFLPFMNLMDNERLTKCNFKMIFFITGSMAIGVAAKTTGASQWIANMLFPYLSTGSTIFTLGAVWLFGVVMNFIVTPLAAIASFTVPITEMAIKLGINPQPVLYTFLQGLDQYIFPYEYAVLLILYTYGYTSLKDLVKVLGVKMVLSLIFVLVVSYPYWKLIGLFS